MKTGRYPAGKDFPSWLRMNFKESPVHALGLDHWDNPLVYDTGDEHKTFVLISKGADGILNTSDDLRTTGP